MTFTPKQWFNFHQRVLDLWSVFTASYNTDTGGLWICADSGTAKEATEAERLRVMAAANATVQLQGSGAVRDSVIKLRLMGRGGSLPTDTGVA